jgi:dienelactone hydrolase
MHARLVTVVSVLMTAACGAGGKGGDDLENGAAEDTETEDGATTGDESGADDGANTEGGGVACINVSGLAPRNNREVLLCNDLGEPVIASVAVPEGDPPPGGWPGVVVLHGSGGLFFSGGEDDDDEEDDETCTEVLQHQFHDWAERLTERGYAVVMPASYYSRGFCEWGDDNVPEDLDKHECLIRRTFDAAAAVNYLCDDSRVDCSRIAVLGFSSGAVATLLFMHEHYNDAQDPRLYDLEGVPPVVGAIAYYPGCGLEGEIINELDQAAVERYYFPRAPVWVPHAEKDPLLDDCEDVRDPQVDVVAEQHGVTQDMFDIHVYEDAKHGFDGASENGKEADFEASMDAQAKTLAKLAEWF